MIGEVSLCLAASVPAPSRSEYARGNTPICGLFVFFVNPFVKLSVIAFVVSFVILFVIGFVNLLVNMFVCIFLYIRLHRHASKPVADGF